MNAKIILLSIFFNAGLFYSQGINTLTRDNAGESGSGVLSGFYETSSPVNYPSGATGGWHLLDVRYSNSSYNYAMQFSGSFYDQNLYFRKTNNNGSQLWNKVLMQDSSGKVGIGVDEAQSTLEVANANGATLSITTKSFSGTEQNPLLPRINFLGYANGKKASIAAAEQTGNIYSSKLSFFVNNGSSENSIQEMMTIQGNGNVGIGAVNPQSTVEVADSNGATLSLTTKSVGGTEANPLLPRINFLGFANGKKASIVAAEQTGNTFGSKLSFFVNNGDLENSIQEMMTIQGNGNVGIGAINPQSTVEVADSNGATLSLTTKSDSGTEANPLLPRINFLGFENGKKASIVAAEQTGNTFGSKLSFFVNNGDSKNSIQEMMTIEGNGSIDIKGKSFFKKNVSVDGKLEAKEVKVTTTPTADFVFEEDYKLPELEKVEKFIKENKHLPEIASAKEMEKEGVNVGEFQIKLLQKIEELTLYTIEQNKQLRQQQERIEKLEKQLETSKPQ